MTIYYLSGHNADKTNKTTASDCMDVCAKETKSTLSNNKVYSIKCYEGSFVDPFNTDLRRRKKNGFKWLRVNKEVFNLYLRFLRTGSRTALHQAERKF